MKRLIDKDTALQKVSFYGGPTMRYHFSKEMKRTMKGLPARRPRRIRRETIEDLKTFGILAGYTLAFMAACLIYITM